MRAGRLDRRVTLQADGGTETEGKHVYDWASFVTVWAEKIEAAGREAFLAGIDQVELADVRFRIRWRDDVTPKTRLLLGAEVFDIVHVAELGRREGLELWCRRRSTDQ